MTKELDDKTVFDNKTGFNDKTGSNPRIDLNGGSKMRDLNNGDENSAAVSCDVNTGDMSDALTFDANTGTVSYRGMTFAVNADAVTAGGLKNYVPQSDDWEEKPLSEYKFSKWLLCDRQGNIIDLRKDIPSMERNEFYVYAMRHSLMPFLEKFAMLEMFEKERTADWARFLIAITILAVGGRYIWNHFL